MKIGIPTDDGTSISAHFGRSAAFLVYEVEGGKIVGREVRKNGMHHAHQQGECDHSAGGHEPHSHAGILTSLDGCETVICAGMGQRAAEALKHQGIQIVLVAPAPAEDTVTAFLAGKVSTVQEGFCRCHH